MQVAPSAQVEKKSSQAVNKGSNAIGVPRLVDMGADKCVPCKMMAPILDELRKEHNGKLKVEFIDVWKNRDVAKEYGIQSIPTQIFFGCDGREFYRHEGFMPKADIVKVFEDHGIHLDKE